MLRARSFPMLLAIVLSIATPGCFVFDESLYMNRDASTPTTDGGPPLLALADVCTGEVPVVSFESGATSWLRSFDTRGLSDDHTNLSCTGRPSPGPEGFFAIDMTAGERWHIHVRRRSTGADPVLYLLRQICDERNCDRPNGLDACRTDSDEHLSLVASATGRYFVGIDSSNSEGFAGSVEVFRPECGNGVQEHGESCEPGVNPSLTCSDECRVVLAGGASEHEVNDDAFMANELDVSGGAMSVGGRIGALCELDVYAVDVPEGGGSIRASLRTAGGADCPSNTPSTELQLVGADGIVVLGTGTARGTSTCPSIDETDTFANGLAAGRYHLRVYAVNEAIDRPFDYSLRVEVVTP
ncbi:hypothetical protein [Sandaracinus amylolyticus]|uniref:hypothetical protein n=1 Tax=Sandaracinus amylolyticus TaxID=927083 RepID=UPI001F231B4C|nr:hypothetical protein [Sandaracinus amylolyticus]UJR79758.1 Hypothetical protein I5071_17960 [Sandaracinus amylolyticus]